MTETTERMRRRITEGLKGDSSLPSGSDLEGSALPTDTTVGRSDPEGREESPFRPDSEGEGELSMFGIFSDIV